MPARDDVRVPSDSGEPSDALAPHDALHRVVPPTSGHHRLHRPPVRWRRVAAVAGVLAGVLGGGVGVVALRAAEHPDGDHIGRPAGPSARHITARRTPMPLPDAQILELLGRPADLGQLTDPQACLNRLGATRILGAAPVTLNGGPAVLLVLPAAEPTSVSAVVVAPDCPAADRGALARTELARP